MTHYPNLSLFIFNPNILNVSVFRRETVLCVVNSRFAHSSPERTHI